MKILKTKIATKKDPSEGRNYLTSDERKKMKYTHAFMPERARNENVEMKNSYSKYSMYAGKFNFSFNYYYFFIFILFYFFL